MKAHAKIKYLRQVLTNDKFVNKVSRNLVNNYLSDCSRKKLNDNDNKYEEKEEHKIYVVDIMQQE